MLDKPIVHHLWKLLTSSFGHCESYLCLCCQPTWFQSLLRLLLIERHARKCWDKACVLSTILSPFPVSHRPGDEWLSRNGLLVFRSLSRGKTALCSDQLAGQLASEEIVVGLTLLQPGAICTVLCPLIPLGSLSSSSSSFLCICVSLVCFLRSLSLSWRDGIIDESRFSSSSLWKKNPA